jgi:DNA-binding NarL/FixJ family response regulator
MPAPRPRVLIAEDHVLVLEAFKRLLEPACEIVGTVTDGQALVTAAETLDPEIVLVDIGLPRLNGLDAIERVKQRRPRTRVIVLTMTDDADTAAEAIRRGASGYVLKASAPAELFEALDEVLRGRVYVTPAIARGPSGVFAADAARRVRTGKLTLRQREVLQLLAEGRSMKEAADVLGVTPRTIAFHKYSMMEQLGLKTTAELVQHAIALGLVMQASTGNKPPASR